MILLYLAQRRDSQKQGFCGDHTRLGSRTLMDVRKLREGDTGREGSTEDVWDISSFNSPSRTAARQMSITHLWLVSPITGNCTVVLIIILLPFSFLFFSNVCSSVCVPACALQHNCWFGWSPWESETAERPDHYKNINLKKKKMREGKKKPQNKTWNKIRSRKHRRNKKSFWEPVSQLNCWEKRLNTPCPLVLRTDSNTRSVTTSSIK